MRALLHALCLFAVVVLVAPSAKAQVCEGDFELETQADVDAFDCAEVTGGLTIDGNGITNLDGLSSLTSVGGYVRISGNPALTSLDGLSGITSVDGSVRIEENDALVSLDGLNGLTSVGDDLSIEENDALTNVDALASLTFIARNLLVRFNPVLSECKIGLGDLLWAEEEHGDAIGGGIDVRENAPGCNSRWEAMGGAVDTEDGATPLVTGLTAPYPNPTAGAATLTYSLAEPAEVTLTLYDALGRRVRTLAEGPQPAGEHEITLGAGLPAGTYVVRFEAGGQSWTERVTVVR